MTFKKYVYIPNIYTKDINLINIILLFIKIIIRGKYFSYFAKNV